MDTSKIFTEKRPWGEFRQYVLNQMATVKTILVKRNESTSLQSHQHRSEFWRIVRGMGEVTIGDKTLSAKAGDEFVVPQGAVHRLSGGQDEDLELLEISAGEFDENDIFRIEDKYGRS